MSSAHLLTLMIKPPRGLARMIASHPRAAVSAEQLHVPLLALGDRRDYSDPALTRLIDAVAQLQLFDFTMRFDRIHDWGQTVSLRPSVYGDEVATFERALRAALSRDGIAIPDAGFSPELVLDPRGGRGERGGIAAISPIGWRIEDLRLMEALPADDGRIEHARIKLVCAVGWEQDMALAA